jgi:hypothetical protein
LKELFAEWKKSYGDPYHKYQTSGHAKVQAIIRACAVWDAVAAVDWPRQVTGLAGKLTFGWVKEERKMLKWVDGVHFEHIPCTGS